MPRRQPAKTELAISRRAKSFFKRTRTYAPGLDAILTSIRPLGEVVAFGGLLRNAALFGLDDFRSDIDLVIALSEPTLLDGALESFRPERTSLGGYRLRVDSFQVDIWSLESTWAFKEGFVKEVSVDNLVRTTFFNWDAIAFSLDSGRLFYRENYVEDVLNHFLDVVLASNPNPLGMAARTIRLLRQTTPARISPNLVRFLSDVIENADTRAARDRYDAGWVYQSMRAIAPILRKHLRTEPEAPLHVDLQMGFWQK